MRRERAPLARDDHKEVRAVKWFGFKDFKQQDRRGHDFAISPRVSREFCSELPALSEERAQGMPGARCAR
jgi:hypothetical protein